MPPRRKRQSDDTDASSDNTNIVMSADQFNKLLSSLQSSQTAISETLLEKFSNLPIPGEKVERSGNFSKCTTRFDGESSSDVEAFIDAITTYKSCANINNDNALRGLPMLFVGMAATWWQGIKSNVSSWDEALASLKNAFGIKKPAFRIFRELIHREQAENENTEVYVCHSRALISKLPYELSERMQLDLIYGQLHKKIRTRLPRDEFSTFADLLRRSRNIEESLQEGEIPLQKEKNDSSPPASDSKKSATAKNFRPKCKFCGRIGHEISNCRNREMANVSKGDSANSKQVSENKSIESKLSCYGCGMIGYVRPKCPKCNPKPPEKGDAASFNVVSLYSTTTEKHSNKPLFKISINGHYGTACADTGASRSIAGEKLYNLLRAQNVVFKETKLNMSLADGHITNVAALETIVNINIETRTVQTKLLVLPESKENRTLLGMDFLQNAHIVIDAKSRKWYFGDEPGEMYDFSSDSVQANENIFSHETADNVNSLREDEGAALSTDERRRLNALLAEYQEVFQQGGEPTPFIEHHIDTGANPPVAVPPYRLSPTKKDVLKKELDRLLDAGIIEECESPYAAPVVLVPKPNGDVRLCIDYRRLNEITTPDSYPLPRMDDLLHAAKHTPYMSTIDLRAGYHQISVHPSDRDKTTFVTLFGTYRFTRMPFGLRNAPATFQRLIDRFRNGLPDTMILGYLDDLIVLSSTFEDHLKDLKSIFERLLRFKLHANREKCNFTCPRVKYLGHWITSSGIEVDPSKTEAISKMPMPQNVKQVQSFLQTCSWYRRFIPHFSEVARPLSNLTKKNVKWQWGEDEENAFNKLKDLLTTSPILKQCDESKPYVLRTDASSYALGAVLLQGEGAEEHPIEYASRLLTPAERNYSTTEREALAVIWALNKFRGYVDGSEVTVASDHQPLKWLMSLKSPSGRLARWALQLQSYHVKMQYIPGKSNVVADMLSRPIGHESAIESCEMCTVTIDMPSRSPNDIRTEQLKDDELRKIIECFEDSSNKDADFVKWTERGYLINNGVLYKYSSDSDSETAQLVVPSHERAQVLKEHHDAPTAAHDGADRTFHRIATRYYWTGMRKTITDYVKACLDCSRYKAANQKPAGLLQTPAYAQRFETVAIDLFGPLPEGSNGEKWIFIVEDCATKWVELFPLVQATAKECALTLLNEVFLRFGVPRRIISDNGTQFVSGVMQQLLYTLGVKQSLTPVYHPQANPVERKNRDLKPRLAILVGDDHCSWVERLPAIRFAMNTAHCESTGHTAAYLQFGRELRTPDDVNHDLRSILENDAFVPEITPFLRRFAETLTDVKERVEVQQDRRKDYADKSRRQGPAYQPGDKVWVASHPLSSAAKRKSAKFMPRRDGPYVILTQRSPTSYEVASVDSPGVPLGVYHSSALSAYEGLSADVPLPVSPLRKRGRPRKAVPGSSSGRSQSQRGRL